MVQIADSLFKVYGMSSSWNGALCALGTVKDFEPTKYPYLRLQDVNSYQRYELFNLDFQESVLTVI